VRYLMTVWVSLTMACGEVWCGKEAEGREAQTGHSSERRALRCDQRGRSRGQAVEADEVRPSLAPLTRGQPSRAQPGSDRCLGPGSTVGEGYGPEPACGRSLERERG